MSYAIPRQVAILLIAVGLGVSIAATEYYRISGAIIVGLGLLVISAYLVPRLIPRGDAYFFSNLLPIALLAKMVATLARLSIGDQVYGLADARRYDIAGSTVSDHVWRGEFNAAFSNFGLGADATGFVTGVIYSLAGQTLFGGFLIFGFIAFLGSILFIHAYRCAFPNSNSRSFSVLILLYPTVLYWPSGVGKDALMFFLVGIVSYGAAAILTGRHCRGIVALMAGLGGAFAIRPHIALIAGLAFGFAILLRKTSGSPAANTVRILFAAGLVFSVFVIANRTAWYFKADSVNPAAVFQLLAEKAEGELGEAKTGSTFTATDVNAPTWVPMAFVTVLLRPLPWEAHNAQAYLESASGLVIALLIVKYRGRLWQSIKDMRERPYLVYVSTFAVMLILLLSTFHNFGLLARQRAIVLPLVFTLIAYVPAVGSRVVADNRDAKAD